MTAPSEFAKAWVIAQRVMDRTDPDSSDDVAILARQFVRLTQRSLRHLCWQRLGRDGEHDAILDRNAWFYELVQALDPERFAEGRYGEPLP
jgi:hypothetical protein